NESTLPSWAPAIVERHRLLVTWSTTRGGHERYRNEARRRGKTRPLAWNSRCSLEVNAFQTISRDQARCCSLLDPLRAAHVCGDKLGVSSAARFRAATDQRGRQDALPTLRRRHARSDRHAGAPQDDSAQGERLLLRRPRPSDGLRRRDVPELSA